VPPPLSHPHPAEPAVGPFRTTAKSHEIMKPRAAHIAPSRAPITPMYRGPQAMSPSIQTHPIQHAPNAALLIDFDNVTMGIRSDLGQELRNLLGSDIIKGKVAVQRAYADWRRYPQYIVPLAESSIDMIMAPAYGSSKKNATDIRLAIDAIELVFTRPEIGTFILLSGDSDFSSLVMKLKEYGKYVIGVGIRESSSDLLVQNCDEYYSYNALAGLVKTGEESSSAKRDPWELVTEAIDRMQRNGDVMRSDRLKQVMQEIDSTFDEKNLGFSKFSKFCLEASQKGLLQVTKLENGQLDVAPAGAAAPKSSAAAPHAAAPAEGGEDREGRSGRRGRRGGRGRGRGGRDREEGAMGTTAERAIATASEGAIIPAAEPVVAAAPAAAPREERRPDRGGRGGRGRGGRGASEHTESHPPRDNAPVAVDAAIGVAGVRLTRDEAFGLVKNAVAALVTGDDAVPSEKVRQKAFELLGRDSESLSPRNFDRILRDAHDGDVVDLRKRGDTFEVAPAVAVASVADQLQVKDAALKADADKLKAAIPPAPRGMGARGAPARGGRGGFGGKTAALPPDFLLIGVVEDEPTKPAPAPISAPVEAEAPAAPKAKAKAKAKSAPKAKAADAAEKPKRAPKAKAKAAK
jgi:uncharacterized protein (TIGR00288 family)